MEYFVIFIDGIIYSSWLFIVAAGLTLVYGVMRILNMAHGSFYAVGAYAAASFVGWYFTTGQNLWLGFILFIACAALAGLISGFIIERCLLRFMYGRDEVVMILLTYGILLIMEDVIKLIWGVDAYFAFQPYSLMGRLYMGELTFARYDFGLIGFAALIGITLWWTLNKTRNGKLLRAVIHDREISMAMGVNVSKMFLITFVAGSMLSAIAGGLTAPALSVVPGIGIEIIVLAFAVVVIGGLGSVGGALVGALIVGLARAAAVHLVPEIELFVIYGVMAAVLAFRPEGLFVTAAARKI